MELDKILPNFTSCKRTWRLTQIQILLLFFIYYVHVLLKLTIRATTDRLLDSASPQPLFLFLQLATYGSYFAIQ